MPAFAGVLGVGEVHLWAATLDDPPVSLDTLRALLSEDERRRAERFSLSADTNRSIHTRGVLRMLLGAYLSVSPESVTFDTRNGGKPMLAAGAGHGIEFNVSHSGAWGLIGVTRGLPVGVDVEQVRALPDLDQLCALVFSPEAARSVLSKAPPERADAFFASWTRMEARLKAEGVGLAGVRCSRSHVLLGPSDATPAEPVAMADPVTSWTCWEDIPAPGYRAAAAVIGKDVRVVARTWTGSSGISEWSAGRPRCRDAG